MENEVNEDTNVISLLETIFYFNKAKKEFKILRNSTNIPLLYKKLISHSTSIEDKIVILNAFEISFKAVRHYTAVFSKHVISTESHQSLSLFLILLKEYIKYSEENYDLKDKEQQTKEYLDTLLSVFQLLISNVTCPHEVFEYVYSLFRPYLYTTTPSDTKTLSKEMFQRYFDLLSRIYRKNINTQPPSHYLYFSGNGELSLCIGVAEGDLPKVVSFHSDMSICIWFKTSISKEDSETYFTKGVDLINILYRNNSSTKVYLSNRHFLKSTTDPDLSIEIQANQWNFLVLSWYHEHEKINTKIFLNKIEVSSKPIKPDLLSIHIIMFFTKFIGEASSVLFIEGKQHQAFLTLFSDKRFIHGIKSEKDFIAFQKNLDINSFNNYASDLFPRLNIYPLSDSNSFNRKNMTLMYIPSRYKQERPFEVTLFHLDLEAKITVPNSYSSGVNIFKKNYKSISDLQALYPLLPLMEMMILSSSKNNPYTHLGNCISTEILKAYFELVIQVKKNKKMEEKYSKLIITFFQLLSLFLERLPKVYMTFEILQKLQSIISDNDPRIKHPPLSLINEIISKIILNEKIYFKFSKELQDTIWQILDKHYENKQIGNAIPMIKITSILLAIDKNKYSKYCCLNHSNLFINESASNTVYNLKDRLNNITTFLDKILTQKPEEIKVLFSLLTFEISPCLQLYLVEMLTDFIENKSYYTQVQEKLNHLFTNDYNVLELLLFTFSVSVFDVKLEILSLLKTIYTKFVMTYPKDLIDSQFKFIKRHLIPSNIIIQKTGFSNTISSKGSGEWEKLDHSTDQKGNDGFLFKDINKNNLFGFRKIELNDNEEYFQRYLNKEKFDGLINSLAVFLIEWWMTKDCPALVFDWLISITPYITILRNFVLFNLISKDRLKLENELSSNKHSYIWFIDITFQVFISQDPKLKSALPFDKPDDRQTCQKEANDFIIAALKLHSQLCAKAMYLFDYFMEWCYYYKELYQNDNPYYERLISFIVQIIEIQSNEIMALNINHSNPDSKEEICYLSFCSIFFEYIIVFKLGKHFDAEKTFFAQTNKHIINIPGYYSALFTTRLEETETPRSINDKWENYTLFKVVIDRSIELFKDKLSPKTDYIVKNYFESSNQFDATLSILTMENYSKECKTNKGIPLIIILCNTMSFILNETETESDFNQWLNNYYDFLRYLIVASTNISQKDINYTEKQQLCQDIIGIGLNVLINQLNWKTFAHSQRILGVIKDLLILIDAFVQKIHQQVQEENEMEIRDKMFSSLKKWITKDKSGPKTGCAVFKLFGNIFYSNNVILIRNTLKDDKLLKEFVINDIYMKKFLLENQKVMTALDRVFVFNSLNKERKRLISDFVPFYASMCNLPTHSDSIIRIDTNYIEESYFVFKTSLIEIINNIRKWYNTIYQLYLSQKTFDKEKAMTIYRRVKVKMFTFRGLWSDSELYYSKREKMKYKVLDHLTKDYTRPLLFPLIDYEYYLPQFTDFQKKNLFIDKTNPQKIIDMDLFQYFNNDNDEEGESNSDGEGNQIISRLDDPENLLKRLYATGFNGIIDAKEELRNKKAKSSEYIESFIKSRIEVRNGKDEWLKYESKEPIQCCLIRGPYHIKGYFLNDCCGLGFYAHDWEYNHNHEIFDKERNTCYGSLFKTQIPQKQHYHLFIKYGKIERIFKRRYIFRQIGIEIYTIYRKSFYFLFQMPSTRDLMWNNIERHLKTKKIDINYSKIDKHIGLENQNYKFKTANDVNASITLTQKIDQWINWKISTMEMIMYMNILANRTYNDFMQYPVFPWILTDYKAEDKGEKIRNFATPIGMLDVFTESQNRKNSYCDHFELMLSESNYSKDKSQAYVYGTHYSNAMYVSYYLMRVFPFTQVKLELQGSCFDNPNRLFNSLDSSFTCAATQKADIRELIPEFFCFPEMFQNVNCLDFGEAIGLDKTKTRIQGVVLPNWCQSDSYEFVNCYRRKLESPEVSSTISQWFDIIFGYRQKGDKAKEIYNVFLNETYESYEKEFDKLEKKEKEYICRMIEFGVTPHQIFSSKVDQRKSLENILTINQLTHSNLFEITLAQVITIGKEKFDQTPSYIKVSERNSKLMIYTSNKVTVMKYSEKMDENERKLYQYIYLYDYTIQENELKIPLCNEACISSYNKGECIVKGGYINGQLLLHYYSLDKKDTQCRYYMQEDMSRIIVLTIDQEEKFIFCGTEIGYVHLYFISQYESPISLSYFKTIKDHQGCITAIHINNRLSVFATVSLDGFIMLYTFPHCKLFNIIKLPHAALINHLFISSTPLPSIAFFNDTDKTWNSYSINGRKLTEPFEVKDKVIRAKFFTDITFIDHIVYTTKSSNLYIVSLPKFEIKKQCEGILNHFIDFEVTNDRMACVVLE